MPFTLVQVFSSCRTRGISLPPEFSPASALKHWQHRALRLPASWVEKTVHSVEKRHSCTPARSLMQRSCRYPLIKRLQAFELAGAEVLFAPGLPNLDAVRAVCAALSKP